MRLVSAEGALLIDELSQKEFGISGPSLMEEAGHMMSEIILNKISANLKKGLVVVCGPGNNGGDGRVIAKRISESGVSVRVYSPEQFCAAKSTEVGVIVDAIFGVGLTRPVEGVFAEAIEKINKSQAVIVSVDLPSGLSATSGRILGTVVNAQHTLMVLPLKVGAFLRDGPGLCGVIHPVKVSFPPSLVKRVAGEYFLLESPIANSWLPRRNAKFNKSNFGHAYIVAGSPGCWGAAVLAARSAYRAGAGYVVHSSATGGNILAEVPEAMSVSLENLLSQIKEKKSVGVAIGPGSGYSFELIRLIRALKEYDFPVLLDADALTLLSRHPMRLRPNWIMTPHSGELARLLKLSVEEIEADPTAAAKSAWRKFGCTVVLKGFHTIVTSGYSGRSVIVNKGNVALAKAGTGDVLTGIIVGFLAQNIHPLKAALLGVYVHGFAADDWVRKNSNASLSASDLVDSIARILKRLETE